MIYALVFFAVGLLAVLAIAQPRTARVAGWLSALILMLLAALRADSVDYYEYTLLLRLMEQAEAVIDLPWRIFAGKDPLFGALMAVVLEAGWRDAMLFAIAAVLGVALKVIAFERGLGQAAVPLFASLCLYYFLHDFTQIRVAIALGWCYWGFVELQRQRPGRALLLGLIGAGFHASAAMLLFYGPVHRLQGWKRPVLAAAITAGLAVAVPLAVSALGDFGNRGELQTAQASVGWTPLLLALFKLGVLVWLVRDLRHRVPPALHAMLRDALLLCAVGTVLMFAFVGVTAALAFRSYELFDAFSVFIIAVALSSGGPFGRLGALLLCVLGVVVLGAAGLLVPYRLVSG